MSNYENIFESREEDIQHQDIENFEQEKEQRERERH